MAELEIVDGFFEDIPRIDEVRIKAASATDISEAVEKGLKDIKLGDFFEGREFKFNDEGEMLFTTETGKDVKFKEISEKFYSGEFKEVISDVFGFDMSSTEEGIQFLDSLNEKWRNTPIGAYEALVNDIFKLPEFKLSEDPELFNAEVPENIRNEGDSIVKEAGEAAKNGDEKGTEKAVEKLAGKKGTEFLKKFFGMRGLMLLLAGLAAYTLYDYIKGVQDAVNGCWLVSQKGKCKVLQLTCKKASRESTSKAWTPCVACDDVKQCGSDPTKFIPIFKKGKSCDEKAPFPGTYYALGKLGNPCKDNKTNDDYACPNVKEGGCITAESGCSGSNSACSKFCNSDDVILPVGATLQCTKINFGTAAAASAGNLLSFLGGSWLGKLFRYVLIGVAVIVSLLIVWKVYKWLFGNKEEELKEISAGGKVYSLDTKKTKAAKKK